MIRVGSGDKFKRVQVQLGGKETQVGPDTHPTILRRVINDLSAHIGGQCYPIPVEASSFTLYEIVKQLSILIIKHRPAHG
jgi:hypothetical protein